MSWRAPEIVRVEPPTVADERATLEAFLDYQRQTLLMKCAGLTADELRRRATPPSGLSLLGLVRHMSEVERAWFRRRAAGQDIGFVYLRDGQDEADFEEAPTADAEADLATFASEIEAARAAVADRSLEDTFFHPRTQTDISVRWVYAHMIEEYARHNGHADLLRESIDGATGE